MLRLPQAKEHFSLEVMIVLPLLLLLATTAQDGKDWMICNQLDEIIEQSSMVIKFMSLEETMRQSKSWISTQSSFLIGSHYFTVKIYRNLGWRWRFKKHQTCWTKVKRLQLLSRVNSGWYSVLCQTLNKNNFKRKLIWTKLPFMTSYFFI